jgi:hypothetical protein
MQKRGIKWEPTGSPRIAGLEKGRFLRAQNFPVLPILTRQKVLGSLSNGRAELPTPTCANERDNQRSYHSPSRPAPDR